MMDQQHWVIGEDDEHTVCGKRAEGQVRSTNLERDGGHEACPNCFTLWTRYSVRRAA